MTPAQAYSYGYGQIQPQFNGMLAAVRDDLYPSSVTNQMRRRGGGTELTPANVAEEMRKACAEVEQDQEVKAELLSKASRAGITNEVLESYFRGRMAGVSALTNPGREPVPTEALSQANPSVSSPPQESPRSSPAGAAEVSPLRDLIVQRHEGAEDDNGNVDGIWLACSDGSLPPEHLCNHDSRTGQVSFSPDEQWIVVTDGGGPGSSMGTELRVFRHDTQNHYSEIPDAGLALAATRAALQGKHVPDSVKLGHVYAEVEGWSADGKILKLTVWGHGPGYPGGGVLETTQVGFDMAAAWTKYRNNAVNGAENNPPQEVSTVAGDVRAATVARERADAELNEVYNRLMRAVSPVQQKLLRDEERAWIKWQDAEADRVARSSAAAGGDYHMSKLSALTGLIQQRSQALTAALGSVAAATPSDTIPTVNSSPSTGLQKRLPNGAVADPYANYKAGHPSAAPAAGRAPQSTGPLSRVYTVPELKKLSGTRPTGAGLRGDFILVSREGNRLLLQSRVEMRDFGFTMSSEDVKDPLFRGHTFINVTCSKDMSGMISDKLVKVPAEQPLRIVSVTKNSQGRIDVEATF